MSGLQQPLASMRFVAQPAGAGAPRDVTQELLALFRGSTLDADSIVAQSDVFKPTKGGAEHMAADMGVPFLGRVPLDPALSLAGVPQVACLRAWMNPRRCSRPLPVPRSSLASPPYPKRRP